MANKNKYFIFMIFVLILIFPHFSFSNIHYWSGKIIQSNLEPLSNTYIHNLNSDIWIIADNRGDFFLNKDFSEDDTIIFTHIGYKPVRIILSSKQKFFTVIMQQDTINMESVTITGSGSFHQLSGGFSKEVQNISKSQSMGDLENSRLLQGIPGLSIKGYGGPAGISTISLDGGSAAHTKILIAGFDLTNPQNGQMDISQIPAPFVEKISYYINGINQHGSGTVDGVISLNPWQKNNCVSFSLGNYGHTGSYVTLSKTFKKTTIDLLTGFRRDEGNYKYLSYTDDKIHYRKNNDFKQNYFSARVTRIFSNHLFSKFFYLDSSQERGVAGPFWGIIDTLSFRQDRLYTLGLSLYWINPKSKGSFEIVTRNSDEEYSNPYFFINSQHKLKSIQLIFNHEIRVTDYFNFKLQGKSKNDHLESRDTGSHSRNTYTGSLLLDYSPFPFMQILPTLHFEKSPNLFDVLTYETCITLAPKYFLIDEITLQYASQFRYPSFNELFWQPGGNPNLKQENTDSWVGLIGFKIHNLINLKIQGYYKQSDNLILWMPQSAYWTPKNIKKSNRKGYKTTLAWEYPDFRLAGSLYYARNISQNLQPGYNYNKPLRYSPFNTASFSSKWNPDLLEFFFQAHYTGEKIVMYGYNPQDKENEDDVLKPYLSLSISIGYHFETKHLEIVPVFTIDNFTDKYYETIKGYPEPGRSFRITVNFNF